LSHGVDCAEGGATMSAPGARLASISVPRRVAERHAAFAIAAIERLDRAVDEDRADRGVDAREDALRLAERVAEEHARPPCAALPAHQR
jgi:hypothetical protein